jgi:hypothetical protein
MLDPTVGEGVVTAMRKEVHRMELRHAELLRVQERLMQVRDNTFTVVTALSLTRFYWHLAVRL